jgi:hypothetical protein
MTFVYNSSNEAISRISRVEGLICTQAPATAGRHVWINEFVSSQLHLVKSQEATQCTSQAAPLHIGDNN